jgi:3-oxoacyl-[acyl-carrier protein] reductase
MSDFLLELGQNKTARQLIESAGLPIPVPEKLRRARGAYEERPLFDQTVVVSGDGMLADVLADALVRAGGNPFVVGDEESAAPFRDPGEAFGRPATVIPKGEAPEGVRADALVFDATGIDSPEELGALHDFFHPWVRALSRSGRIVVLGRPPSTAKSAKGAAARAALEGFTRSVAKEVGKLGATGNLVVVEDGAEERVPHVLRFLLSPRSAFVTTQPLHVTTHAKAASVRPFTRVLEGKVALVTGAARGIGAATVEIMAREGAHVVCLDRPEDDGPLSKVARDAGGTVLFADVTDADAPTRIAEELRARHGGVDIIVHNAGITRDKLLRNMTRDRWDQAIDVNLGAVVRITDALLEAGAVNDEGRIVLLSSIAGLAGNVGQTNYAASKSGLVGVVEVLSKKLAKRGITVNAVAPGFIETRLTAAIPVMIREAARRMSALGQGGLPEDVGQAIAFLSTPGADGLTGNVLRVCGGALVGR